MSDNHPGKTRSNLPEAIKNRFVNACSDTVLIIRYSIRGCMRIRVFDASASLTFYMLFSLFPLILIIVAGSSYILKDFKAQQQILEVILNILPDVSHRIISQNMEQLLESRGTVGIVGTAVLLWAATSVFSTLVYNLNRAWPEAPRRNLFKTRLYGFSIVVFLVLLLPLFFIVKAAISLLSDLNAAYGNGFPFASYFQPYISSFFQNLSNTVIYLFVFVVFMHIYRWAPKTHVRWSEAAAGAMTVCIASGLATKVFSWYLSSGLSRYNLIYGSLGALVAFFYWIFIINLIVLFGAHLSASIARYSQEKTRVALE